MSTTDNEVLELSFGQEDSSCLQAFPKPGNATLSPVDDLSFRVASEELEGIVRALEDENLELEESLLHYERGVALLRSLKQRLSEAQQKVQVLMGELEPEDDGDKEAAGNA